LICAILEKRIALSSPKSETRFTKMNVPLSEKETLDLLNKFKSEDTDISVTFAGQFDEAVCKLVGKVHSISDDGRFVVIASGSNSLGLDMKQVKFINYEDLTDSSLTPEQKASVIAGEGDSVLAMTFHCRSKLFMFARTSI
jgi:hypothetical protein